MPKEESEKGSKLDGAPQSQGAVPELAELKKGGWGKLPPKLAEDINKGISLPISEEYREAVETYYRVIAEKSKKQ